MNERTEYFADPQAAARYAENPPRIVPGLTQLQRMTTLLLAERVPERALWLSRNAAVSLFYMAFAFRGWVALKR
jgi:tRNA (cmo5U34)-methyltransferase